MGEGRGFAGRAAGDDAVDAFGDLPCDEFLEGGGIHRAILERGDQSRNRSLEHPNLAHVPAI
jgi:hypothetical protein